MMTDYDVGGEGGKNGDFWMTSFVNDPLPQIFRAMVYLFS